MKTLFFSLAVIALSGCAAQMIDGPTDSVYAPLNEASRPKTIRYLNQGAGFVIDARREDAYKQMYATCNRRYKIVSEGPRQSGGVAIASGNSTIYESSEYWYITFTCVPRRKIDISDSELDL